MKRPVRIRLSDGAFAGAAIAVSLLLVSACWAQPAAEAQAERPAAGQTEQPSSGGDRADELERLAHETVTMMRLAHRQLSEFEAKELPASLQSQIVDNLRRLAELAGRQPGPVDAARAGASASGAAPGAVGGPGGEAGSTDPDAGESTAGPHEAAEGEENAPAGTRELTTSVWGHLPPRQRERMQARFSERFLPQYEALVRQYYEALATEGLGER